MKTQLANFKLPPSVWQSLHQIDNLLGHSLPWAGRLEEISNILLTTLEVDAVWLLTIKPLPVTAYGLVSTPLTIAPDAQVQIIDQAPPLSDHWPGPDSLLRRAIANKKTYFIQPDPSNNKKGRTDSDLGDVLFGTFDAIPSAIVPLVAHGEALGALIVASHDLAKIPPPEEIQNLLIYLGEHLGTTLKNAYLVERSQRHANALMTLNQIAHTITSSLDIDEVIRRTMAGINEMLEVEAGSLLLIDEQTDELYFKITLRGENKQVASFRLRRDEGIAGWVTTSNQPAISNNVRSDKRFSPKIDQAIGFVTRMVLCVPLIVHGKPIGALEVLNKRSGLFDEDDQELLISMSASLGIALENASLYEAAQERLQRIEVVNQIIAAINTSHGLSDAAEIIFEQFGRLLPFDHISVSLIDDSKENIRQWVLSEYGALEQTRLTIPLKASALAQVIEKNQGLISTDISKTERDYLDHQILFEDGVKSKLALPLTTQKGAYGSLNLGHRLAGVYSLQELEILEQLMPQVSVAIEKARTIDLMEQRANELQMLNHLGEMLASTTDINLIVDTALSMLPRLLPGDVQGIIVADEEGVYLGVAVPFGFNQRTDETIEHIIKIFAEMSEGHISLEPISSKVIAGNMPVSADWKPVKLLSFPILTRQGARGLIYLASGKQEEFSNDLLRIFSLIVSQISAAVGNALLFQEVEQERARLAAILASSTDAVLVVNRTGRIVLDNPAAWTVMGVNESQSGKLLSEITQNKYLTQLFESAIQAGKLTGEIPLMDGRTFFANLSPVSAGEAGIIGWVATMQDVSHFKELNELKNDFVNSVSHDLRSPLSSVLIATHLLPQMGDVNEIQQELLETVENRVRNMSDLIDNLLDVGKIEANIDMEMEACHLTPIINEVVTSLRSQANDKSIRIMCELDEDLPFMMANPTRLRQVAYNLVGNAIKYTPNEGRVIIKTMQQAGEIRMQVIDTGLGIAAADQPHIFEKFYRVRGDHVTKIEGSGLGLAITKSIMEKHQGRVWLESVFGEGSTFTVAFPLPEKKAEPIIQDTRRVKVKNSGSGN